MENQYPAVTPANKSTYLGLGAKAGSLGFAGANLAYRLAGKGDLRFATPSGLLKSTFTSALLGGVLGAIGGANVTKSASANTAFDVKETDVIMNQELLQACEMAKLAADMSLPLEKKPAPEAGSQPVQGMTDNSTYSPTSVGASTYAGQVDAAALAKARAAAAMAMAKQASEGEDAINRIMDKNDSMAQKARVWKARTQNKLHGYYQDVKGAFGKGVDATKDYAGKGVDATREYANKGMEAGKEYAGRGVDAVRDYAAKNPKLMKGLKYGGGAAAVAGAGYGAYRYHKEKRASIEAAYEDYMDKLASIEETGVTSEEAYFAAEAAVELYNDCLEKMAYAEELFNDADNYFAALEECEEFEKQAAEYMPIASSTLGALAGATAGYVAGAKFPAMRNGVAMAGMATGGAALGSALNQFKTASAWRAI